MLSPSKQFSESVSRASGRKSPESPRSPVDSRYSPMTKLPEKPDEKPNYAKEPKKKTLIDTEGDNAHTYI